MFDILRANVVGATVFVAACVSVWPQVLKTSSCKTVLVTHLPTSHI